MHSEEGRTIATPITTPDIFPTLFGMLGLSIPDTYEGDDLSEVVTKSREIADQGVLDMQLTPWVGGEYGKEYRAMKIAQYTYVRSLDGPWLLFDDLADPFQLKNLEPESGNEARVAEMDRSSRSCWKK